MDAVQYEVGERLRLDAIREPAAFQTDDLHQEDRRPSFSRRATDDTGVVSMLCYRLFIEGDTMGSLNLYSKSEAGFDARGLCRRVGLRRPRRGGTVGRQSPGPPEKAIETRHVIGQAKGIIMARQQVDADEAFEILRRGSQRLNRKLRDVAEELTAGATRPSEPPT